MKINKMTYNIESILTYGAECWALNKGERAQLR
jgi:hypothetical protein